jgi:RNA polymerase sigma-70 factor, ECF subfamily
MTAAALSDHSDGELAARIAAGHDATVAEQELYRRFVARVRAFGRRHLRDDAEAGDFAQDVLLTVIEGVRAGRLREADSIGGYVFGTCRMLLLQWRRETRRDRSLGEALQHVISAEAAPSVVVDKDQLAHCLELLPMRDRTVILLTFYADRDGDEIAAELRLSSSNVRVIRHRALARLESCLEKRASGR